MSGTSGQMSGSQDRGGAAPLATVVYSSLAVTPFSDSELRSLIQTAQMRNHAEGVTGVVLYDNNRFFQWLEGPAHGVQRIMSSIRSDRRHTDVQVITERVSTTRQFDGWDMKLAAPVADPQAWRGEVLEPPREIVDDLRRRPAAASALLVKLLPPPAAASESPLAASLKGVTLNPDTASVLKELIRKKVIPRLLNSHRQPGGGAEMQASPRAAELADLLVATDQAASMALIRELREDRNGTRPLFGPLFEPAARSLGDMFADDAVSEFEVTLGLCRLQSAVRLLGADAPPVALRSGRPHVMIAPAPGELHQLVAALDSEWLWSEGWSPMSEFPADDSALTDLLSTTWVDILDLSMSAAFRRAESLPRLTKTIALARRASLNPNVVVLVGGRAFVEDGAAGLSVGADLSSRSSADVDRLMAEGFRAAGRTGEG